jgi:hypothetical protein
MCPPFDLIFQGKERASVVPPKTSAQHVLSLPAAQVNLDIPQHASSVLDFVCIFNVIAHSLTQSLTSTAPRRRVHACCCRTPFLFSPCLPFCTLTRTCSIGESVHCGAVCYKSAYFDSALILPEWCRLTCDAGGAVTTDSKHSGKKQTQPFFCRKAELTLSMLIGCHVHHRPRMNLHLHRHAQRSHERLGPYLNRKRVLKIDATGLGCTSRLPGCRIASSFDAECEELTAEENTTNAQHDP